MFTVVDLFAGAGGLSLGFAQTKKYDIKVAFENSPYMQDTYRLNHPGVEVQGDVCRADYADIKRRYGKIDVVIGGPPCQGFSNANRQKNAAISQNNKLVKQYIRAILELDPDGFVMENVSMLRSEIHRFYMEQEDEAVVEHFQIPVKDTLLQLIDGEYAFDGVLEIIQNDALIQHYLWPENDYFALNVIFKASQNAGKLRKALDKHRVRLEQAAEARIANAEQNNPNDHIHAEEIRAFSSVQQYYHNELSADQLKERIEPSIMIQRMLSKAREIFDNHIVVDEYVDADGISARIRSFAVYDYLKSILESEERGYVISSDVLCAADFGAPQKRMRFVVMGIKRAISPEIALPQGQQAKEGYRTVRDAISDLQDVQPVVNLADDVGISIPPKGGIGELAASLRNSSVLKNHIVTATTETALERFRALKQGDNFHKLDEALKTNTYTNADRTQNTIYLRLNYDEPSGTVVNVRKSMWIHPELDRAISIREAARLQTFPDSFVFCGSKDKQYQQVGNAVPPIMAKSIAKKLAKLLMKREKAKENG